MLGSRLLPVVAASVTVVLWASAFIVIRAAAPEVSPGPLALGRMTAGAGALTLVVLVRALVRREPLRLPSARTMVASLLWGAAWFGVYNLALNTAETRVDAGTAALLVNLAPVLVGVLAGVLLGEGFPRRLLIGLLVAFSGGAVIAVSTSTGRGDPIGLLLASLAAVLYAAAVLAQKRLLRDVDALTLTWIGSLAGTAVCTPFWPELVREGGHASTGSLLAMLYLGLFPTAIAFLLWGWTLSRTTAGRLSAFTFASPPIAVLLSWLLLGEAPEPAALLGGAVGLAGVAIATAPVRDPIGIAPDPTGLTRPRSR